jgi:2-polyprenyl-3-methyl-5-hydroxy-6-metoxy-1,4-benzoquinol methylase
VETLRVRDTVCRFCKSDRLYHFVDLGVTPLCQRHVTPAQFNEPEPTWPLQAFICAECHLAQLREYVVRENIFDVDYAYFSSFSDSWLAHAKKYCQAMRTRFGLGPKSQVVEAASNDGYLLQWFVGMGIPVLGIEPAANCAAAARQKGVPSEVRFMGVETGKWLIAQGKQADLLLGNNVLAHVPDLNDFVGGLKLALKPEGVLTMEFPHLQRLIEENQFDTIYQEHYSYLSLLAVKNVFQTHDLDLFDVEELPTHGGSLRIFACHKRARSVGPAVTALLERERSLGYASLDLYAGFGEKVRETKRKLLTLLIDLKRQGKRIAAYGAPGKGNTLLNYCGIKTDILDFTVDRSPHKQGNFLPGSRIPIEKVERIKECRPDYLLVLPWNLKDEIMSQTSFIREWGGRWVVPIPEARILD